MKKQFAIALYENEAESDDELTFKKNDLFQVIQFDYLGMEGWWLCKMLKSNKTGLAAGNRLKIVTDTKMLLKINTIINQAKATNYDTSSNKSNSVISSSSSTCSVLSSNSSNSSATCTSNNSLVMSFANDQVTSRMQSLSLQPTSQPKDTQKPKIVLPAKLNPKLTASKTSFLTESTENILNLKSNLTRFKQNLDQVDSVKSPHDEDDDDYDYDVPENRPVEEFPNKDNEKNLSIETNTRKSSSPTIDSGVSTSSLASFANESRDNKMLPSPSKSEESSRFSSSASSKPDDSSASTSSNDSLTNIDNSQSVNIQVEFNNKIEQFTELCHKIGESRVNVKSAKEGLFGMKELIYEFLVNVLKRIKEEHACFHPNLNVFNQFKTHYRQIKEFYLYFEATLNTITKVYQWSKDILVGDNVTNEFQELLGKISYFKQLVNELDQLVEQTDLFSYHSEISITKYQTANPQITKNESVDQDYEYEYDNNNNNISSRPNHNNNNMQFDYDIYERIDENDDYSDYCQIDETEPQPNRPPPPPIQTDNNEIIYSNIRPKPLPSSLPSQSIAPLAMPHCMTLKKNEEKIKREIKIAANSATGNDANRINLVDQMLLKFYLKHIEDNLNELNSVYEYLMNKLMTNESVEEDLKEEGAGHKLAINGHKLVFICDTLERNLNNTHLKTALYETSSNLCESLKLYMIRIKTTSLSVCQVGNNLITQNGDKQQKLIMDSLKSVLGASNKFKQVIIKYYFKSY